MSSILFILSLDVCFSQKNTHENHTVKPFVLGKIDSLWSGQLSEERYLNIYLPEGYDTSRLKYPVIYLLDGSANEDFIHICGIVQFLVMIEAMPKTIVVGIANVDRKRDFTFPTSIEKDKKDYPTTGHSDKFILFMEKELLPFVQKEYRINDSSTIIGQSLGGLVSTEMLLEKPSLFENYIIVSPSLWWDNESLLKKAPDLLKSSPGKNTRVYLSVGNEGEKMINDSKKLRDILQGQKNIEVLYNPEPNENHLTILHNCIYKALSRLNRKK